MLGNTKRKTSTCCKIKLPRGGKFQTYKLFKIWQIVTSSVILLAKDNSAPAASAVSCLNGHKKCKRKKLDLLAELQAKLQTSGF